MTILASVWLVSKSIDVANESRLQDISVCEAEIVSGVCTQDYLTQVATEHYTRQQEQYQYLKEVINDARKVFEPILQLLLIVLVFVFLMRNARTLFPNRIGDLKLEQNSMRSLIALIVVVTFAVSIFVGNDVSSSLKDVVLVVVAFYFGSMDKMSGKKNGEL